MEDKRETLCWKCQRPGTGTCVWDASMGTVPVGGWTAELRPLFIRKDRCTDSYRVLECPQYIEGKKAQAKDKRVLTPEEIDKLNKLLLEGARTDFIVQKFGISPDTVRRRRRKLLAKLAKEGG